MKKVLSFNDYVSKPDVKTETIQIDDNTAVTLGAVSSADIIEWFEENEDTTKKRFAGLRLLVKCWINEDGTRIGEGLEGVDLVEAREVAVRAISRRPGAATTNGQLVAAALKVNGLSAKKDAASTEVKND